MINGECKEKAIGNHSPFKVFLTLLKSVVCYDIDFLVRNLNYLCNSYKAFSFLNVTQMLLIGSDRMVYYCMSFWMFPENKFLLLFPRFLHFLSATLFSETCTLGFETNECWHCCQANYYYLLKQHEHDRGKTGFRFSFSPRF